MKTFFRVAEGIFLAMIVMAALAIILRTIIDEIIK